ncbi:peptidoglycan-binding domain-containing protein [Gottfriedia acidiceleris]|uniref:peptidoglycan-binding domain-containing protein n=1 Tax=Gottfriedia acidiceleris TaxID=371036 RepID=UPI00300075F9
MEAKPPAYPGTILKSGSKGNSVKLVQKELGIKADGIFGPITDRAVRNFQKKNGLTVDRIVGPKTWAKLFD